MEDDAFDIYDDLEEFDYKVKYDEAANAQKELQEQLTAALKRISELEERNEELQDSINNLEKSFQSLLETARAEIRRKDAKIAEARKERDDVLFRRKGNHRPDLPQENVFRRSESTNARPNFQGQTHPVTFEKQNFTNASRSYNDQPSFRENSRHADLGQSNRTGEDFNLVVREKIIAHESNDRNDNRQMTNTRSLREDIRTKDNKYQHDNPRAREHRRSDDNEIDNKNQQAINKDSRSENRRSGSRGGEQNKDEDRRPSSGKNSRNSRNDTDGRRRDYRESREQRRHDYHDRDRDRDKQNDRYGKEGRSRDDSRTNHSRGSYSDRRYERNRDRNDENYSKHPNTTDRNGDRKRGSHDDGRYRNERRTDSGSRRDKEHSSRDKQMDKDSNREESRRNSKEQTENRREVDFERNSTEKRNITSSNDDEQLPKNAKRKMETDDVESSTKRMKYNEEKSNKGPQSSKNFENERKDQVDIDEYSEDHLNALRKQLEMEISAEENTGNFEIAEMRLGSRKKQTAVSIGENDCSDHKEATSNRHSESSRRHSENLSQEMSSDQNRDSYDLVRELASTEVQPIQNRESNEPSGTTACEVFPANHIEQYTPNETQDRKLGGKSDNKCYRPSETTQCEQLGKVNTDKGDIGETHAIPNEEKADERTDINEEKKRGFGEDKNMNNSRAGCLRQNDVNNPQFKNLERKSLKSTGKDVKPCNVETSEGNEDHGQISGCHKPPLGDMEQQSSHGQISEAKFATSTGYAMIDHNTDNLIAAERNNHDEMELNGYRNEDRQSSDSTKPNSLKATLKPPLCIDDQLEAPSMPALDASVETCNETLISKQTDKFKTECSTVENKNNASSKSARVLPKGDISNDSFNESTGRLNTSALLSYETYLANHTTPVPVPASEDEIAGTPAKPKTTKKPRRTTQKASYNALVGHRIEGFERRIPAKKSTLDTSRELKQELFREALGQRSSTPIKPLNLSSSSISDTSFNTSTTEVKGEKRIENDNQQMKMNVQKEKKNFKLNLDLSFGENRVITKEDVKVMVTDNDLRSMSNLSKSNSSSEGTNRSERDTKSSSGINSSSTTSSSDKSSTTSSSDKSIIPSKSEDNFTSCTIDNVTAPSNYPTKKQKIMTQLMKQNSCEQLITNIVTASANGVNAKEESIPESGLESSDIEKKYPPAIKSANPAEKTSTMQNGDYSKRKNESLEQELPPPKRRNTVEEGHAINSAPDLNIQNLEKNILEQSKDSLSSSRIAGTEISSHSGSDTATYSSSTEKSNPSINSGDSSETKQSTCEDLGLKQNNGDNCLDLTNDMDTKRAAIEQLMRDLNWSSSDQHSSDLEKSETEKKSDDHMIPMDKSKECDSSNPELSKFREEIVSDDPKSVESSKKNKIEILDVQIVTRGCALELPTANVRNNTDDVKGHSNQNIIGLSKNVDDSEKYRSPHDEEKTIKSSNTNRSRPSVTKKPLVQGNHTRNTRRANQNGMNAGESSKTKISGTSNDHVIDKIVRDPNESSKTKPTISTASPTRDCKNNAPSQKINFNETENNSSHANTFAPMQKPESTSNPIQSTPKTYDKNNSLHDSELQTKCSPNNSLNESQYEKRNISMASSDYVIEKVDNNVINVFITRRKVKKKKKN